MFTHPSEDHSAFAPGARPGEFCFGGRHGTGIVEYANLRENPGVLDRGAWIVCAEFDGPWRAWRVAEFHPCAANHSDVIPVTGWVSPQATQWTSSLSQATYAAAVTEVQRRIAAGDLDQVNLGRILSVPLAHPGAARGLGERLRIAHPAPFAGWFDVPAAAGCPPDPGLWLVSASPELGLRIRGGVAHITPIKGTALTPEGLLDKDRSENVLITGGVRAELARLCPDARVTRSLQVQQHPGLVQLVSTVTGTLARDPRDDQAAWAEILGVACPPVSVFGVPSVAAAEAIGDLEPVARGPYCGQVGWIDVDAGEAELAVVIRSFWWTAQDGGTLRFGTGAGITAGSDPEAEWEETELKARRLLDLVAAPGIDEEGGDHP